MHKPSFTRKLAGLLSIVKSPPTNYPALKWLPLASFDGSCSWQWLVSFYLHFSCHLQNPILFLCLLTSCMKNVIIFFLEITVSHLSKITAFSTFTDFFQRISQSGFHGTPFTEIMLTLTQTIICIDLLIISFIIASVSSSGPDVQFTDVLFTGSWAVLSLKIGTTVAVF